MIGEIEWRRRDERWIQLTRNWTLSLVRVLSLKRTHVPETRLHLHQFQSEIIVIVITITCWFTNATCQMQEYVLQT